MKRIVMGSSSLAIVGALGAGILVGADSVIESKSNNGMIQWQVTNAPSTCRVEWASSSSGPWKRSWHAMTNIVATGSTAQVTVPLFFRVIQGAPSSEAGLVLHLPFNGDLLDHSPYGNNPTSHGAVSLDEDREENLSSALRIDSGEYLTVPGSPSLALTNVTVALWAKLDRATWQFMLEMGPFNSVWSLFIDQSGGTPPNLPWHFYVYGGGTASTAWTDPVLTSNRWYHFAATFKGTQAILYQDGLPAKTGTVPAVSSTISSLYIGRSVSDSPGRFSGWMDDIRIYNRVLTSEEIAQIQSQTP